MKYIMTFLCEITKIPLKATLFNILYADIESNDFVM